MADGRPKVVVIAGPTASGKSTLAVALARHFHGEIVNADSMQVYRYMNVGTAKPSATDKMAVPHHLIDVVDPDEDFNAALYRSLALPLLKEISVRRRPCFLVGGTGLYIKILLGGIFSCSPTDSAFREALIRECDEGGSMVLHERLRSIDPESAQRIHPHDRIRIMRALEIIHLEARSPSLLMREHGFKERPFSALKFCLQMDREQLYKRINQRTLQMIDEGLVMETKNLLDKGYPPELKSMQSLGYRHVVRFLQGDWDLDETIRQIQRDTRRYAKRQITWFKADPEMIWISPEDRDLLVEKTRGFFEH